jgi:ABC-type Fe3+-siderophore transport system permease subunit
LTGAVISAVFAVAVVGKALTDDYTHPMLLVLGVAAAVAAVFWFAKAIRSRNRP